MPESDESRDLPPSADDAEPIPRALIDRELERVTGSRSFEQSRRHQRFLRHLVVQTVAGNTGSLKEPLLAHDVFERRLDAFDPARDTIVRVEARRLRQRLERYYGGEGSNAALEIHLPVGSYVPMLRRRLHTDARAATTRHAKDLAERGDHFLRLPLSRSTLAEARDRFDAALRESPDYVPALVGLGRAWYNIAAGWHDEPRPAAEHAMEALRKALALDPGHAVAHALLGAVVHQFEYDWPAARSSLRRAVALAPEQAFVHSAYGCNLLARNELAAAEHELSLARRLDPQYVNARIHMVNLRIAQGHLDHAQAELDAMLDIAPDSMPACAVCGLVAMLRGEPATALRLYERVCTLAPDHANAHASLAAARGFAGDVAGADATLAAMFARFGDRCVSPYVLAIVATRCGRHDRAFACLAEAVEIRDPNALLIAADPSFAALRTDARWTALVASLVPSARAAASAPPVPPGDAVSPRSA